LKNREIAKLFEEMADILEIKGQNVFKINAYRKAARVIGDLSQDLDNLMKEGSLRDIPGVGEGIAKKIKEYLETGQMSKHEELRKSVPEGLLEMMAIPGMGPKTVALVHKTQGISTIAELETAVKEGRLRHLPGLGPKKEENILRGISLLRQRGKRIPLGVAIPILDQMIREIKEMTKVKKISPAGSLRRMKETIGDIDILVAGREGRRILETFTKLPQVQEILAAGDTKGSVIVHGGLQVDLRVVPETSFGAALQYFTGSKAHNIHLREIAKAKGMKISEYGIFRGERQIGGRKEEEIYNTLGLDWIPPEMREDRGEVALAAKGKLPSLVQETDIRGDLHVHSSWSDGSATMEEMALAAQERNYQYVAICDHSQSLKFAGGLSQERILKQIEEIRKLNEKLSGIAILAGTEVDIKTDGSLDFPDGILEKLDLVVAAIHSGFKQSEETIAKRLRSALENPHVDILAHPTGRLISSRPPYRVNLEELLAGAAETGTALEINAYYDRLDLTDVHCQRAAELGVKLAIGTDAHHPDQLWMMRLGIATARRGWLEKEHLLNTLSLQKLRRFVNGG
jgi:DNA polymerase (family 10)